MPIDLNNYPKTWKTIALSVKTAADWTCQHCNKQCRKPKESIEAFFDRAGIESEDDRAHPQRFALTTAHLDHDSSNPKARLAALCAPCHLRYDAPAKAARRKKMLDIQAASELKSVQ